MRFLIVLGAVLLFIICAAYFFYGLQPVLGEKTPVTFEVVKGESFRSIGARLSTDSLIRSITVFKLYSFVTGSARKFQPGVYALDRTMSVPEIVRELTRGVKNEVTLKVIEGAAMKDIDAALANAGVTAPGDIINMPIEPLRESYPFLNNASSLEGFLFPDTYQFAIHSTPEKTVRRFLDAFKTKAWPLLSGNKDWYQSLTLASYLEKEVVTESDRRMVAGILLKRFSIGMPLQVDATILYAKCRGAFESCGSMSLTKQDMKIDSPFNTYTHRGFTPGPIGNPGEGAIRAAMNPTPSAYLYYLSTPDGKTVFSKTLLEHGQNQTRYF